MFDQKPNRVTESQTEVGAGEGTNQILNNTMDVPASSASTEEDVCMRPKIRGKIGLVRKLTKRGPPKLFLMKNKKVHNPKGGQGGESGGCSVPRCQAGIAASDVLQEDEETAAAGDWTKRASSENPKHSPWAVSPGIDETAFGGNTESGDGESRSVGEGNEEMWPWSSPKLNGPLPETEEQNCPPSKVPSEHKIKPRKEARHKSERQRGGLMGASASWGSLICVKKNRKIRVNEAEERSPNDWPANRPEPRGERQKRGSLAAQVCEAQSEDTWNSAGSKNRTEGPEWNLSVSGGPGLSAHGQEGANEPSVVGGDPEVCRPDSRGKLRRKSSGWASFRYLMKSKKEWRCFTEGNVDCSGSQGLQGESAEAGLLQDCQEPDGTALSKSKPPLKEQVRGQEKEGENPNKDPEGSADPTSRSRRDSEILHPEAVALSLSEGQDLHFPRVSESCQPEIHAKTEVEVVIPATLQDQEGLAEDNGQALWVNGTPEGDQHPHDLGFVPLELVISPQTRAQGLQHDIGITRINPSHLLDTDDPLQKRFTPSTLGVVTESERRGLAKGWPDGLIPALIGSGDLQKPSTIEMQTTQLLNKDNAAEPPEPLAIETPVQESDKHESSNEISRKNANPVCSYPKQDSEQEQDWQGSKNEIMLSVIGQGALSGGINVDFQSFAVQAPTCDATCPSNGPEEEASCECRLREWVNWNDLSDGKRHVVGCDGEREVDPASDVVSGLELLGLGEGPEMHEAVLVETASCLVQSAMKAAVEQLVEETAMKHVPENAATSESSDPW
ncbi:hypothetical protein scyTo_0021057 [Scyliorhinus torazame]|uniref:Uncharacterized protein n=1 Tax=Scyliorhinus torazame TaxID=75743 RepID=A0A401PV89_SCYTO|nr:hypothetical protein [Scyliorhinus torazame]